MVKFLLQRPVAVIMSTIAFIVLGIVASFRLPVSLMPEIDIPELVNYGKSKNVGIILWAGYHAFDRDMEKVVKHY